MIKSTVRHDSTISSADFLGNQNTPTKVGQLYGSSDIPLTHVYTYIPVAVICSQLSVPRIKTKYADRSFAVQGPRVWNSPPAELRVPDIANTETLRKRLKKFLCDTQ